MTSDTQDDRFATRYSDTLLPSRREGPDVRRLTRHVVLSAMGRLLPRPAGPFLRPLYCHYVYDDQVDAFRFQMRELQRIGRFVTTAELVDALTGRRPVDGCELHLSFDDGFDNVYRNAAPVLHELGIPATFFVSTGFVGATDETTLAEWFKPHEVARPTRSVRWDELRRMPGLGFEIGSHTHNHARLADISGDPRKLCAEIDGSKKILEDRLGAPCRWLSWPYGTAADVDDRAIDAIREAGFSACFSAVRGTVVPGRADRFRIPRHHFEPQWPWPHIRYFAVGGHKGA